MDKDTVYMVTIIGLLSILAVVTYLFLHKNSCRVPSIESFDQEIVPETPKPSFKPWNADICPCSKI